MCLYMSTGAHSIQHPICTLSVTMARFTGFMSLVFSQLSVCVILLIIGGIYASTFQKSAMVHAHKVVSTLQVGGQNLQQQVMQQGCRPSDILIAQGQVSRGGIPRFSVTVFNSCLDDKCSISQIIVNCGDFAGITRTNPAVFRRLQPGTCLVNDGRNLQSGSSVTFDYSQEYMEPLSVRSADVSCSRS